MRLLVTGGAGFIGSTIARKALDEGNDVVVLDSLWRKGVEENLKRIPEAEFIKGDVRNREDIEKCGKADFIVHCAANPGIPLSIRDPVYDFNVNALGTVNVLEYGRKNNSPLVYCSTNKVYSEGYVNSVELVEEEKRYSFKDKSFKGFKMTHEVSGPSHSPYGVSKLAGDLYCQEFNSTLGLPTIVNRMSCIYGTHQFGVEEQGWVAWFVLSALNEKELNFYGNGKQVRDLLFGEDLAELVMFEMDKIDKLKGSVFNVGGTIEKTLSLIECKEFIEQEMKMEFKVNYFDWRPADHKVYISDIGELERHWKPKTTPQEGLKKIIEWAGEKK